ncbi:MAG: type I phosphodiesterase/nucleotide pyrophosphatase [Chloroflexi bacterium OLB14]|nr:MAG: type I phosphodiesterase/nucleotide pyrophosphatase [Chloroflexi bacterium OLB14]
MKRLIKIWQLIFFTFLLACQTSTIVFTPTATFTATHTPTATQTPQPTLTSTPTPLTRRVLILSIDGLRPDAITLAPMPTLLKLIESSAYSLSAQTIRLSATLPAHASMLSGLCPNKHGVDWNDYLPEKEFALGTDLFDIAHAAGMQTAMFVGKEKLRQITEPASTDVFQFINDRDLIVTENLIQNFPADFRLLFIHFATTDDMGHVYGWLSGEQLSVIYRADQAIEKILAELDSRGIRDETLIIITADHGGLGDSHTSGYPEDMTIPWIANGAGIVPKQLTSQINTVDTAATAAYALGLDIPTEWDGVPVYEAFGLPIEKESKGCN